MGYVPTEADKFMLQQRGVTALEHLAEAAERIAQLLDLIQAKKEA
jgi:hypothetical protein